MKQMAEVTITFQSVGPDKAQIITIVQDVLGWDLHAAKSTVDRIAAGEQSGIAGIPKDQAVAFVNRLLEAGASVYIAPQAKTPAEDESAAPSWADNEPRDNSETEAASEPEPEPEPEPESEPEPEPEPESEPEPEEPFKPPYPLSAVSRLDRENTLTLLAEVKSIALEAEKYDQKLRQLGAKIAAEEQKAIAYGKEGRPKWVIIIPTIAAVIIFTLLIAESASFAMIFFFSLVTWVGIYLMTSRVENVFNEAMHKARAEDYREIHIAPLLKQADEIQKQKARFLNGEKCRWAVDVVGGDMFYSAVVGDLYDLVKSRRADNLKEALNLYDDVQHKERMANAAEIAAIESAKQTALNQEIEKNTHAAATAAKWTAVNTFVTSRNVRAINKNTRRFR